MHCSMETAHLIDQCKQTYMQTSRKYQVQIRLYNLCITTDHVAIILLSKILRADS